MRHKTRTPQPRLESGCWDKEEISFFSFADGQVVAG
jgi:hypothetical protein